MDVVLHELGGSGSPLLVCHATGFHGRCYQVLADELVDRFRVFALDFRGHGASPAPDDGDFGWYHMAAEVLDCIDRIGAGPIPVVGHSLGGSASVLAARARPGSIAVAYLFEPVFFPQDLIASRGPNPMAGPARSRRAIFASRDAAHDRYASRPPLNELHPRALRDYVEHGFVDIVNDDGEPAVRLACLPEHEARVFEAEEAQPLESVAGTRLDGWVVRGDPTVFGPGMLAEGIADAIDGVTLVDHPELGHFGPLQDPERIGAEILRVLG